MRIHVRIKVSYNPNHDLFPWVILRYVTRKFDNNILLSGYLKCVLEQFEHVN